MAIVINGSGTVTGLAVGGLPDGTVDADTVAADVATQAELDLKANIANFTSTGIDDNATSTAITISSDENVGIGVTPETWSGSYKALQLGDTAVMWQGASNNYLTNNTYYNSGYKYLTTSGASHIIQLSDGSIAFGVAPSGSADSAISWIDAMTIDNSANLIWYQTPTSSAAGISFTNTSHPAINISGGSDTGSRHRMTFTNGNGLVGNITTSGSSTAYNTSSDYRLKENVVDMENATDRVKQLKPKRFNFIADDSVTVDGFIAHEVSDIVPEAISGEKDAMMDEEYEVTPAVKDEDGNIVTEAVMGTRSVIDAQSIDQSKLVPLLVKTIQELEARITALEA